MNTNPKLHLWFKCPVCWEQATDQIEIGGLAYYNQLSFVGHSGHYDASCSNCGEQLTIDVEADKAKLSAQLSDYPEIAVDLQIGLSFADIHQEPPPANPWQRFMDATDQIKSVMNLQGSTTDGAHMVNRMVFTQYIAAFEAYLAETLIRNIEADGEAIAKLVGVDPKLKAMRFSLAEILKEPELVQKEVRSFLREVIYHRLDQVHALYGQTLGIRILEGKADSRALFDAVGYRHDCVHRNGFDKDGKPLQVFTPTYIEEIAAILMELVGRVEASIQFKGVIIVPYPA